MLKKVIASIFILFCLSGFYAGWRAYQIRQNTAERAAQDFVQHLNKGETTIAYQHLTPTLIEGRETYWQGFLKQFKGQDTPRLINKTTLKNTFNTYAEHSEPQQFTYDFKLNDKNYQLVVTLFKVNKNWRVGELYGDYTP